MSKTRRRGLAWPIVAGLMFCGAATVAADNTPWFVSFERIQVAPVKRSDTTQLVEAGTIETDGFTELVFSLGGEFKEGIPVSGTVGAVLIPDIDVFTFLLETEGKFVFPLEASVTIGPSTGAIFISDQQRVKVAFPRYRIFLYNETKSGAIASLFVYRTR